MILGLKGLIHFVKCNKRKFKCSNFFDTKCISVIQGGGGIPKNYSDGGSYTPLFLCGHCSPVLTVSLCPLSLCVNCPSPPTVSVATVPRCPLFLCAHYFSVPTIPLCKLSLCVNCPSVSIKSAKPLNQQTEQN